MTGPRTAIRELIRSRIFERFDASLGLVVGAAQVVLLAWVWSLLRDPAQLPSVPLALAAWVSAGLHAALYRSLRDDRSGPGMRTVLAHRYAAAGFGVLLVVSAVALCAAAAAVAVRAGVEAELGLRAFRAASVVVALACLGLLAWAAASRRRPFDVSRLALPVAGLDSAHAGLRLAHLSDLHIGNGLEGRRLHQLVERVGALEPDLVVLTGDLFDRDPAHLEAGATALGRLSARLGVFAVLGNHDVRIGASQVAGALERFAPGVQLLRDAWQRLPGPAALYVAGVDDPGRDWTAGGRRLAALDKLAASLPNDGPALLLVHRPDAFPQAAGLGFGLVLAGHFHGGQVAVPGTRGRWNVARALTPFDRGLFEWEGARLYVSRGLGFAGPRIRLGSPPEIALLELSPPG